MHLYPLSLSYIENNVITGCTGMLAIDIHIPVSRMSRSVLTVQLPPLRQGFPEHSLTWTSQLAPVYPGRQEQV